VITTVAVRVDALLEAREFGDESRIETLYSWRRVEIIALYQVCLARFLARVPCSDGDTIILRRVVEKAPDGFGQFDRLESYRRVHETNEYPGPPALVEALLRDITLRATPATVALKVSYPKHTSELNLAVDRVGDPIKGGGDVAPDGLSYRAFGVVNPVFDNEKPDNEKPVPRLTFQNYSPPSPRAEAKKRKREDATRRELAKMKDDLGTYWYGWGLDRWPVEQAA